jgi:FkbM family methyltransferase
MDPNIIPAIVRMFKKGGIKEVALASGRRLIRKSSPVDIGLRHLMKEDSVNIVQVGAFTGNSRNDPLYSFIRRYCSDHNKAYKSKIILVEPVREYFEVLQKSYRGYPGVYFEKVVIAEKSEIRDFYRLAVNPMDFGYPDWLSQLGSLMPERMTRLWDNYEKNPEYREFYLKNRIVEKVQCLTLGDLLENYHIDHLDFLQIDAEGYDYEILKTIDYKNCPPDFINYERVLLGEHEAACRSMLKAQGYSLVDHGQDTFCVKRE